MTAKTTPSSASRLRIVVHGYLVRGPLGGLAWHYLQYVLGLVQLGHEVVFIEQSDDYPSCYDPDLDCCTTDPRYGVEFVESAFARLDLGSRWAFLDTATGRWYGKEADRIQSFARASDLCLNISGTMSLPDIVESVPVRAYVDTDPAFTQIRLLADQDALRRADQHNVFFTFGENLPAGSTRIPAADRVWLPTRQPVVLDQWPVCNPLAAAKYTSVLVWASYSDREYRGQWFRQKAESFTAFIDLPQRAGRIFELALGGPGAPGAFLETRGWDVVNPIPVTRDPWTYQRYIQQSKGEFGIAKHGYVVSDSGWFSERSACYLATGRPVIVQDTGFTRWLRAGDGVLPFDSADAALGAIEDANARYEHHCRAAREIAEAYFDSRRVLTDLVEQAMNASVGRTTAVDGG